MTTVRLVTRADKPEADSAADRLARALAAHGVDLASEGPADIVAAIGGDGTVLEAASDALAMDVPVCGVNVGRVGYLAEFAVGEIDDLATAIGTGGYDVREHSVVHVSIGGFAPAGA